MSYWGDEADVALADKIAAHPERLESRCIAVTATDTVVVVQVPPFPRFD